MKPSPSFVPILVITMFAAFLVSGCSSSPRNLKKGPTFRSLPFTIHLSDIPNPKTFNVISDAGGNINDPAFGQIKAAGQTADQIEADTSSRLGSVDPDSFFYVEGRGVKDPGKFLLNRPTTVMHALARAGGVTEFAHPWKVEFTRGTETVFLDRGALEKQPELDIHLQKSDRVFVH